jgi:hypothetical protein
MISAVASYFSRIRPELQSSARKPGRKYASPRRIASQLRGGVTADQLADRLREITQWAAMAGVNCDDQIIDSSKMYTSAYQFS